MAIWMQMVVDQIELVVAVPSKDLYSALMSQLYGLSELANEVLPSGKITITKQKYLTRLNYYPSNKRKTADLILGTTKSSHLYFKLVLYPPKFKGAEFSRFKELLGIFFVDFNYETLFHIARVSRIDFAADVLFHDKSDFIPLRPRAALSSVFVDAHGHLGSVYLGGVQSDLRFCIYDKGRQLKEKGLPSVAQARTRIEARLRRTKLKASDLHEITNPFLSLEIADYVKAECAHTGPQWADFLGACQQQGAPSALSVLNKSLRRKYLKALRGAKATWWNPHSIWEGLPDALKAIAP